MPYSTKDSIDFYNTDALEYDKKRWSTKGGIYINNLQKSIVVDCLRNWSGKKVLDIATGTGRFALEIAKNGAFVTVIDSSKNMLEIVERKFEKHGLKNQLKIYHGSGADLPFQNKTFDVCVCINAMNHIPQYKNIMKEIFRVLNKDGVSVTNYTNWMSYYLPYGIWVNLKKKSIYRDVYTKWFSINEVYKLHNINNLSVNKLFGMVHTPNNFNNNVLLRTLKLVNHISQKSMLKYIAPQIFIKAYKLI
jgi:ubiquinone/menaquinone biosynthesis C-methylase UbiE